MPIRGKRGCSAPWEDTQRPRDLPSAGTTTPCQASCVLLCPTSYVPTTVLRVRLRWPTFTKQKTEARRTEVSAQRSLRNWVAAPEPGSSARTCGRTPACSFSAWRLGGEEVGGAGQGGCWDFREDFRRTLQPVQGGTERLGGKKKRERTALPFYVW